MINYAEVFGKYYQYEYDFNTESLTDDEVDRIKKLVKEKRVDYAISPMGTKVFDWIMKQNRNLRFELVDFESEKIDGLLYIPSRGKERAYIALNKNKPLINQVFTAAHEYYHYIKDYQLFQERPYICNFNMLQDVNEKRASRFAAELLLPEQALKDEVQNYLKQMNLKQIKNMEFRDFATLALLLTIKYEMPLKAVLYRFAEEGYIADVDAYIENYGFIKKVLQNVQALEKSVKELYSTENRCLDMNDSIYRDMEKTFSTGNETRENILKDAKTLGLKMDLIEELTEEDDVVEDEADDDELFSMIQENWR